MGRGFGITAAVAHDVVRELAPEVEALGYTSFWVNDMPHADGLASLIVAAEVTGRIDLGVGVIPLDRRPAATIVEQAVGLSHDRLILGVGSGGSTGALDRVRMGVRDVKARSDARVVVGALGPKMSVLGGEVADGVLFNWMTPEHIAELSRSVRGSLMAYVRCALLPQAEARLTEELGRYAGLPQYEQHLRRMGATALDTCVVGADRDALQAGIAGFESVLDETVVRTITVDDDIDSLLELAREAAP